MTQDRPTSSAQPPQPAAASDAPSNPGRRIILGGIPIAVTLASKPALAMTGQCSVSNALSGNLSHPLPNGVNCGLTPATWESLAGTNQLWQRTGFFPSTNFTSAAGSPGFGNAWIVGGQSLLSALQGGLIVQIKLHNVQTTLNSALFGEQAAAGLLNAAAFSPNNYPDSLSQVQQMIRAIWSSTPSSTSQAQSALNTVATQLSALNVNT
ncbi:MAG TPA: hypothetical protein VHY80_16540 [Stellaceae bacterium]|jgi:hypothetical protein|nr:hypothetical protein [Stellaceae bacterium]